MTGCFEFGFQRRIFLLEALFLNVEAKIFKYIFEDWSKRFCFLSFLFVRDMDFFYWSLFHNCCYQLFAQGIGVHFIENPPRVAGGIMIGQIMMYEVYYGFTWLCWIVTNQGLSCIPCPFPYCVVSCRHSYMDQRAESEHHDSPRQASLLTAVHEY